MFLEILCVEWTASAALISACNKSNFCSNSSTFVKSLTSSNLDWREVIASVNACLTCLIRSCSAWFNESIFSLIWRCFSITSFNLGSIFSVFSSCSLVSISSLTFSNAFLASSSWVFAVSNFETSFDDSTSVALSNACFAFFKAFVMFSLIFAIFSLLAISNCCFSFLAVLTNSFKTFNLVLIESMFLLAAVSYSGIFVSVVWIVASNVTNFCFKVLILSLLSLASVNAFWRLVFKISNASSTCLIRLFSSFSSWSTASILSCNVCCNWVNLSSWVWYPLAVTSCFKVFSSSNIAFNSFNDSVSLDFSFELIALSALVEAVVILVSNADTLSSISFLSNFNCANLES